jgi:hypothetical protein
MDKEKTVTELLSEVLTKYAVPDPKIVGKLPKGGIQMDYVGHADITRILISVDPHWRLVPIAWDNGRPAMNVVNDMATMWFELTILGTSRLAVGSAKANSPDLDKVLYGDALRNGAMSFGISLNLWTKNEWEDLGGRPEPGRGKPAPASKPPVKSNVHQMPTKETSRAAHPTNTPTDVQIKFIEKAASVFGDPIDVCGDIIDRVIESVADLTVDEMKIINTNLKERKAK